MFKGQIDNSYKDLSEKFLESWSQNVKILRTYVQRNFEKLRLNLDFRKFGANLKNWESWGLNGKSLKENVFFLNLGGLFENFKT